MDAGPGLVVAAGAMTFANEWYQNGKFNWRIPVATILGAALVGGLAAFSPNSGKALGGIILIGAATAKFGGHSVVEELNVAINQGNKDVVGKPARKK